MSDDKFAPEIRTFIHKYLRSVGHLELLLFIFDGRERSWSPAELRGELRTNDNMVSEQLKDLAGIVEVSETEITNFQFIMNAENLDLVRQISDLYRTRRHAIIDTIYNRSLAKAESFAAAFKIGKDS